jgi:hypothetical protein
MVLYSLTGSVFVSQKSALICISTFLGQAFSRNPFHTLLLAWGRSRFQIFNGIGVFERHRSIDGFLQLCLVSFPVLRGQLGLLQAEVQAWWWLICQ